MFEGPREATHTETPVDKAYLQAELATHHPWKELEDFISRIKEGG